MASPRVSVIIPIHNAEKHLEQCLNSVLAQTEKDIEVICVNDSSTDATQAILENRARLDSRVTVIAANCHCAGAARNLGMEASSGQYLSFLDADDFFEPEMLEECANILDKTAADIVVYGSWVYDTVTGINRNAKRNLRTELVPDKPVFSWRDMPHSIFNAFGNYTWNKLFRSSMVKEHNIRFQEIPRTNDLLFTCISLVEAANITIIDKSFTHYRINSNTSLQATNDKTPTAFLDAFIALDRYLHDNGLSDVLTNSYLAHLLDGILANANSVRSLQSLNEIKQAISDQIEPRYQLLTRHAEELNAKQLEQYTNLLRLDLADYLLARTHMLTSEKNDLAGYTDWIEWRLWEEEERASNLEEKTKALESSLKRNSHPCTYRLAKLFEAPIKMLRKAQSSGRINR